MIVLVFILFFIEGFGVSLLLTKDKRLSFASSFLVAVFLSNFFLIICNFLGVPFSGITMYCFHICLVTLIIMNVKWKRYNVSFKELSNYLKEHRRIMIIFFFFLLAFLVRNQTHMIWPGDGMEMWATRALEWSHHKELTFSPYALEKLKTWLNYPIFHSLTIMSAQLMYPGAAILSSNNFDSFFIVGIFFSNYFYLSSHIYKERRLLILALLMTFCLRDLIAMVGSGYADIYLCYCFNLVTVTLLSRIEKPSKDNWKTVLFLVMIFSSLTLAKSEGVYRLIIVITSFSLVCRKKMPWRTFLYAVAGTAFIYLVFKKSNPAQTSYSHYLSDINLNINFLLERIQIVLKSFWLSFWDGKYLVVKTFKLHLLMMAFLPFFFIKTKKFNQSVIFLMLVFFVNLAFNYVPFLITKIDGEVFNVPHSIANNVTSRLNLQIFYSIILIAILFFKDHINKLRSESFKSSF